MAIEGSGSSRAGGEGVHNEDVFLAEQELGLYVVCDGASGTPAGEVAARLAAETVERVVEERAADLEVPGESSAREIVEEAMRRATGAVAAAERDDPQLRGLATTVTMLLAKGEVGVVGHRGDSRAYLIRGRRIHRLTVDLELADRVAPAEEPSPYEVLTLRLEPGDRLVLCSDGAERAVEDPALVRSAGELSPAILASRIVSAAHRLAPSSDATAVVVRVGGEREGRWLELSEPSRRTAFGHTLEKGRPPTLEKGRPPTLEKGRPPS